MDKLKVLGTLTYQAKMSAEDDNSDYRGDYRSEAVKLINEQDAEIAELKSNQADLQSQIDILRPSKSEKPGSEVIRDVMYRFACFMKADRFLSKDVHDGVIEFIEKEIKS